MTGPYAFAYWLLMTCNIVAPQVLWFKRVRSNPVLLFISSHRGADRHVAGALRDHRQQPGAGFPAVVLGHLPAPRAGIGPRIVGTIGLFLFLFFLFIRLLPMISIFEVRTLLPQAKVEEEAQG